METGPSGLNTFGRLQHPIDARLGVVARSRDVARLGVADHPEADELQGDAVRLKASSATHNPHTLMHWFSTRGQPLRNSLRKPVSWLQASNCVATGTVGCSLHVRFGMREDSRA